MSEYVFTLTPFAASSAFRASSTLLSTSHNATSRAPLALSRLLMWLLPRPFKPMTATRTSLLAPATWPQDRALSATPAAAMADDLRKERRERWFMMGRGSEQRNVR